MTTTIYLHVPFYIRVPVYSPTANPQMESSVPSSKIFTVTQRCDTIRDTSRTS